MQTPNVCSDILDHVESYALHMFLACGLKITFTSNLKLIISFLVLHNTIITFHLSPSSSTLLISRTVPRLANKPSAASH
jgi:hypothetical protein